MLPIALLTDFGTQDWFLGAMRGEILQRAPAAPLLDITHHVPPQQVVAAAFALACALDSLPRPCVVCAVVDPGVGSARRALCGRIGPWFFSGPDNGLATPLLERAGADFALHQIEHAAFRSAHPRSQTFHGRDLFAPAAARLAAGWDAAQAGPAVADPLRLEAIRPIPHAGGLQGRVMWIDRFGNLISNIRPADLPSPLPAALHTRAGALGIDGLLATYSDAPPGAPLVYWGSAGTLEVAIREESAAEASGLQVGRPLTVSWH